MSYYILRTSESAWRAMGLPGIALGKAPRRIPLIPLEGYALSLWSSGPLRPSVKDRSQSSLPFGPKRNRQMVPDESIVPGWVSKSYWPEGDVTDKVKT